MGYEIGKKFTFLVFILASGSNYANLIMLALLAYDVQSKDKRSLPFCFKIFFTLMNLCFLFCFIMAFLPKIGALCTLDTYFRKPIKIC